MEAAAEEAAKTKYLMWKRNDVNTHRWSLLRLWLWLRCRHGWRGWWWWWRRRRSVFFHRRNERCCRWACGHWRSGGRGLDKQAGVKDRTKQEHLGDIQEVRILPQAQVPARMPVEAGVEEAQQLQQEHQKSLVLSLQEAGAQQLQECQRIWEWLLQAGKRTTQPCFWLPPPQPASWPEADARSRSVSFHLDELSALLLMDRGEANILGVG